MLAAPLHVGAAIYGWSTADGVWHYVGNLSDVPSQYRDAVVIVAKDKPAGESPVTPAEIPPPPPPPVAPPASAPSAVTDGWRLDAAFDEGYSAGLQAASARSAPTAGPIVVGPIVQNVRVVTEVSQPDFLPFVGPVFFPAARVSPRHRVFRAARGRFIQGPAGPPAFGAAGPPPVIFFHGH